MVLQDLDPDLFQRVKGMEIYINMYLDYKDAIRMGLTFTPKDMSYELFNIFRTIEGLIVDGNRNTNV